MKQFTIYLGLNDKDTKRQEIATVEAYKLATNILVAKVGGATIYEADGIYKHFDGSIVIEKTLRIETSNVDVEIVKDVVNTLKIAFNQESVLVQTQEIITEFI